jgi:hypothetical protein
MEEGRSICPRVTTAFSKRLAQWFKGLTTKVINLYYIVFRLIKDGPNGRLVEYDMQESSITSKTNFKGTCALLSS